MKIFSMMQRVFERRRRAAADCCAPPCDPIDHSAIKRMSLRELADLPFDRSCYGGDRRG